jgi:LPXTG-motif cell wall-anchored protein
MKSQELMTLGGTLVVLGIVFGEDRLIGYSFFGVGILLSVVGVFTARRKKERSLVEMR